jgi:hypothetical protein
MRLRALTVAASQTAWTEADGLVLRVDYRCLEPGPDEEADPDSCHRMLMVKCLHEPLQPAHGDKTTTEKAQSNRIQDAQRASDEKQGRKQSIFSAA